MVESNKLRIKKTTGNGLKSAKLGKVKQSMARLLTVMSERKKIREAYKRQLENEYVERKRQEELERIQSSSFLPGSPESRVEVPVLSQTLLRNKYRALKQGVDTLDYIKDMLEHQKQKEAEKLRVRETYNYKKKQVIGAEDTVIIYLIQIDPTETEDDVIRSFKSLIDKQLSTGQYKLTSGEILASHVRNWRSLTLKQKRIVLNFINARRAREAKSEFLTELSLLGQKIAHDDIQRQMN